MGHNHCGLCRVRLCLSLIIGPSILHITAQPEYQQIQRPQVSVYVLFMHLGLQSQSNYGLCISLTHCLQNSSLENSSEKGSLLKAALLQARSRHSWRPCATTGMVYCLLAYEARRRAFEKTKRNVIMRDQHCRHIHTHTSCITRMTRVS